MIGTRGALSVKVNCSVGDASVFVNALPGVQYTDGGVITTWHMAAVIADQLGRPFQPPFKPIEDLPGYSAYRQHLLDGGSPRPYQIEDAVWLAQMPYAVLANPMQCLAGDTEVIVNRGGKSQRMSLRHLHYKFQGGETKGRRWRTNIETRVACFDERASIVSNRVIQTHHVGKKEGFEVIVEDQRVVASADHKFRTPTGYVALKDLRVGDAVLMRNRVAQGRQRSFKAVPERIKSITSVGLIEMYDLTLESPLNNYVANGFVVHNSGKTYTALLAAMLAGHRRILVLCPSISKWVWADEVYKWLDREALILEGLNNARALQYCGTCKLSGRVNGSRCPACRQRNGSTYGYRIHEVRVTEPPPKRLQAEGAVLYRCRKHLDVMQRSAEAGKCPKCRAELRSTLLNTEVTVCNFDILSQRSKQSITGRVTIDNSMPGWERALTALPFDLVIVDESHYLRAFDTTYKKTGKMVYDRVQRIAHGARAVWLISGTPIFGMVRDLYGQLVVATDGNIGGAQEWTERYCDGKQGNYGWDATGSSFEEELKLQLAVIMRQRPRTEILPFMPKKNRQVVYIENDTPVRRKTNGKAVGQVAKLIDAAAIKKHPTVVERVMAELSEGLKSYVLTFRPKHAERLVKLLSEQIKGRSGIAARRNQAEVWLGQSEKGIDPRRRKLLVDAFVAHEGAGVFVATIRSMPGSISFQGKLTGSVHMVDFDTSPGTMDQAEDRGFQPGVTGYTILHYVLKDSVDDDLAQVVLPKFRMKDQLLNDENAANVLAAFNGEDETCAEVIARLTAHLAEVDEDEDEDYT